MNELIKSFLPFCEKSHYRGQRNLSESALYYTDAQTRQVRMEQLIV